MITNDEISPDECQFGEVNGEEASFHYMIMDLEYWIRKDGVQLIDKELSQQARDKLTNYYASKR